MSKADYTFRKKIGRKLFDQESVNLRNGRDVCPVSVPLAVQYEARYVTRK